MRLMLVSALTATGGDGLGLSAVSASAPRPDRLRSIVQLLVIAAASMLFVFPGQVRAQALPGPASFSLGLVDDPLFVDASPEMQARWLRRAQIIGSGAVRIDAYWRDIAPSTPSPAFRASDPSAAGYDWTTLDAAIRTATADGQTVLLQVEAAPSWAQGPHPPTDAEPGTWKPNPTYLAEFATAIAQRFSGHFADPLQPGKTLPRVRYFQAWNEPNLAFHLSPQWKRGPRGAIIAASPAIYRELLNAFYRAVKRVNRSDVVLAAGTAPYGDPPGFFRMKPLVFLRLLYCLSPALRPYRCGQLPHFDALDHHPYASTPTRAARVSGNVSVPDLYKIENLVRRAVLLHHVLPAGPKPLWVTEFGWSTPAAGAPGISPTRQAAFLARALYEFWRQGVSHADWFSIRDPASHEAGFAGAGLFWESGRPKPAVAAFRFPFVALTKRDVLTVWGKAPHVGTVQIQELTGGRWRSVRRLKTTAGGIFYRRYHPLLRGPLRARSRNLLSLSVPSTRA